MSKNSEKMAMERAISDAAESIPENLRSVFKTMLRQGMRGFGPIPFSKIEAGNRANRYTGGVIMKLVEMGLAVESVIETPYGERRAWMLKHRLVASKPLQQTEK
jgi:hypothetical protein